MKVLRIVYQGKHKIAAIRAYRNLLGTGLKESKQAVENPAGILMTQLMYRTILREYTDIICHDNVVRYTDARGDWAPYTEPAVSDPMGLVIWGEQTRVFTS